VKVVGLTGGIATGKSTVGAHLRDRGVPVLDADQVAREVVQPGQPALERIVEAFGPQVLTAEGQLDRAAMRARISADPEARRRLEGITHPAILGRIASEVQRLAGEGEELVVVEAALMVETGSYRGYAALVVVTCAPATQLARVMARDGVDEASARALIATQLPLSEKEAVATHLIRNDGSVDALKARADEVLADLKG
jgi:dephospho-CoA kinase